MACAYITEKQMPRAFWFYAITHTARMMNAVPGKHSSWLASPFLLVHGVGHNKRTLVPLFSLPFFHHEKDGNIQRLKHQAHMMNGSVIGCCLTSNTLLIYNPCNKQYYKPESYRLDLYHLPGLAYPSIKYDGGLFVSLLCDDNPHFEENTPPAPEWNASTPSPTCFIPALSWIFPFQSRLLHHLRTAWISHTSSI
jgi:hypothetical protein